MYVVKSAIQINAFEIKHTLEVFTDILLKILPHKSEIPSCTPINNFHTELLKTVAVLSLRSFSFWRQFIGIHC